MRKIMFSIILVAITPISHAAWVESAGKVKSIMTYSTTDTILINLVSTSGNAVNGRDVEACSNKTTFAIPKDTTDEARARMYAMILAAKATGTVVTVAYDEAGGCEPWGRNPSAYRIIRRMR